MKSFTEKVRKIGINPYVSPAADVLSTLFEQAGRSRGPVPVRGTLNGARFRQTLVKFRGDWRLYLNRRMRDDAGIKSGDAVRVEIEYDPEPRQVPVPPELAQALAENPQAHRAFEGLNPSRQREILVYLNSLKTNQSLQGNITKVVKNLSAAKPAGRAD